jgi:hypothetical protein
MPPMITAIAPNQQILFATMPLCASAVYEVFGNRPSPKLRTLEPLSPRRSNLSPQAIPGAWRLGVIWMNGFSLEESEGEESPSILQF